MKKLTDKIVFPNGAIINNRIAQSPMLTNSGKDELVTEDTINYYGARSKSAGIVIVEYTSVSPNGGPSRSWARDREQLAIYNDTFKPGMKKIAEALKKDGNKAVLQLAHSGLEAQYRHVLGGRVEVPSKIDFPWINYPIYELSEEEVWQIVKDFGEATKRAISCGFDGIEIHGANHYLIQEFFSAYSNVRTDFWGGSLDKRMNFAIEVSREIFNIVKENAPKDFIIGFRISPEEIHGDNIGYTWRESQKLVEKLTSLFQFDYIHLSTLNYKAKPIDSEKTLAELLGESIQSPTLKLVAGGILSVDKMKDAMDYTDIISLGRATLIDPRIAYKIENGKSEDILMKFDEESVAAACLPPGLITLIPSVPEFSLPGVEYLRTLATDELGTEVTHT